jgi:hypothetical protein
MPRNSCQFAVMDAHPLFSIMIQRLTSLQPANPFAGQALSRDVSAA